MAELKHRLYWINRFNEGGLKEIALVVTHPEIKAFHTRYFDGFELRTSIETVRVIFKGFVEENIMTESKTGTVEHRLTVFTVVPKAVEK